MTDHAGQALVGVAAGGGAVATWSLGASMRIGVAQRGAGGGRWTRVAGPPASACCLPGLAVTRTGDIALAANGGTFDDLRVCRRRSGTRAWRGWPCASPRTTRRCGPGPWCANGAGHLAVAWAYPSGNTAAPVMAASHRALDLLRLSDLSAAPAAGRVLVSLRRPFGGRALAAFVLSGRAGVNRAAVARSALERLLSPGCYVAVADTSACRLGLRTAIVRLT